LGVGLDEEFLDVSLRRLTAQRLLDPAHEQHESE
jgi:hypothetical protein